jgi:hypothetical protein
MTDQFKRENDLAEKMRSTSALQQLSEYELKELRQDILSLKRYLQRIPLFDDELVEEVTSTQSLLNKWHDLVERAFAVKQRSATYDQLSNWDNEGGRVPYASH